MAAADVHALILDYGNVLSRAQRDEWFQVMVEPFGVPVDVFRSAYWQHRHLYDAGLPAREYWRRVLGTAGVTRATRDPADTVERLVELDVASWTEYREEVWALARVFRDRGGRTACLSNGVPEIAARIRRDRDLPSWFDAVVVSCEVGLAKPDPRIYRMCLSQLAVDAHRALFVDDRAENVEAAAALGLHTLHFGEADGVQRLGVLLRSPALPE